MQGELVQPINLVANRSPRLSLGNPERTVVLCHTDITRKWTSSGGRGYVLVHCRSVKLGLIGFTVLYTWRMVSMLCIPRRCMY